jgi:transposase
VGSHHSEAYQLLVKYMCSDIELLRNRVKQLDQDIDRKLQAHEVGRLLTTIDGIGARTAACLIAELGEPSRFRDAAALASYVGGGSASAAIGQARVLGCAGPSARKRAATASAVNADIGGRPKKRLVARALRAPVCGGKAAEGCYRGLHAKVAWCYIYSVTLNRRPFVPMLRARTPLSSK